MPEYGRFPGDDFFKSPNEFFGRGDAPGLAASLGPHASMIYMLILRRYDWNRKEGFYESHASMARRLGMSETTLEKHLKTLLRRGLVRAVPCRKRRHRECTYRPSIPLPQPEAKGEVTSGAGVKNTSGVEVKDSGLPQVLGRITPNLENRRSEESTMTQSDTPKLEGARRLYIRLNKSMSIDERVAVMKSKPSSFNLSSLVQAAWEYWKHLWEDHYHRPYYRAQNPENRTVVPKDKKNIRHKVEQVGFAEFIARMERCFEVCDELFPCRQHGKWVRPVGLDDFVNVRFFDQWIPPREEAAPSAPKSAEEKLRVALEKRRAAASRGEPEKAVEDDG